MATTITDRIHFPGIPAARLYAMYTNAREHAAFTGAPADISDAPGAPYSVYGGHCSGVNLLTEKDTLIVQTWEAPGMSDGHTTVVVLRFSDRADGGEIHLTHANIPDAQEAGMAAAWGEWYWEKMKAYAAQEETVVV